MKRLLKDCTEKTMLKYNNGCDKAFYELIRKIENVSTDVLIREAIISVSVYLLSNKDYYNSLLKWHYNWHHINSFDIKYNYLKLHTSDIKWL